VARPLSSQIGEYLRYQGEGVSMPTHPLEDYFAMGGPRPALNAATRALHRGYLGGWEIVAGRLYLVKLTATLQDGAQATLQTLFPGFGDRVFAHWFTGTIRILRGRRLHGVYNRDGSVFEREEMLEFERGVIRKTSVHSNVPENGDGNLPKTTGAGVKDARPSTAPVFKARRRHRLVRLSVAQIEARERVDDPLCAVPNLPFGHLNPVWCALKAKPRWGDGFWSFSAEELGAQGKSVQFQGYVRCRWGRPVGQILTVCKPWTLPPQASSPPLHGRQRRDPEPWDGGEIEIPAFLRKQAD
jgi:hypothetical protein